MSKVGIMDFREEVLKCLGKMPQKAPLEPKIIRTEDMGTHKLHLVQYNVEPGERINAWLLTPAIIRDSTPAILAIHQHAGEYYLGKSEPAGLSKNKMYHYGLDLCLKGYVVLCPDHLAFEDRRPPEYQRMEHKYIDGKGYEQLLFCDYICEGSTLQAKYLWDLSRGIDFLQSLDYVDPERIGAIGHSLGGQETMWLAWYDKRIKVAVCSCGISQIKSIFKNRINHNFAMFTFGLNQIGDISDLVCDIAPIPFLMTNGTDDSIFPMDGVLGIKEKAEQKYKSVGAQEKYCSIIFEGGHSFPENVKKSAYEWIERFI